MWLAYRQMPQFKGEGRHDDPWQTGRGKQIMGAAEEEHSPRGLELSRTSASPVPGSKLPEPLSLESFEDVVTFGYDERLTYKVIELLGMTMNEAKRVQDSYDVFAGVIAELASERISKDEEKFDVEQGKSAFFIESFPEEANKALEAVRREFTNVLGASRGNLLFELLKSNDSHAHGAYPWWGRYRLNIWLQEFDEGYYKIVNVSIEVLDQDDQVVGTVGRSLDTRPGMHAQDIGIFGQIFGVTEEEGG